MFIAAFTIAKMWKQPVSIKRRVDKMLLILHHKKELKNFHLQQHEWIWGALCLAK